MPHGGGLAIVIVTLAAFLLYAALVEGWSWLALLAYLAGAMIVAAVSWLDDLRTLPVVIRLVPHSVAALCVILGMGAWQVVGLPYGGSIDLAWLGPVVTFIWIVGLTNAYNFMDGIDGIAGSQAVIAGIGWAVLGWLGDQQLVSVLGLLIAATSLGFLGHNWPPARIFMGDVGSAFLGYTLAVLPVVASSGESRMPIAGALLVWPFIFDTAFTFIRRLLRGENVLSAHRSHLYQRLIIVGHSHRSVTQLYVLLFLSGALLSIAWMQSASIMVFLLLSGLCLSLWLFTHWQESISTSFGDRNSE
jgi:UDP-N-acetylmuramyl pentapeptide phosphotransferase/UDP-N-acetylglucosamine-1-phosphate transferase